MKDSAMENLYEHYKTQFDLYYKELSAWNEHTNLTAITNEREVITKHFLDSLSLAQFIPSGPIKLIDIGSGAGFPGIPLKIVRQDISLTLVESIGKKTDFLEHIAKTLNLSATEIIQTRAEDLAHNPSYREQYDVCCARAVARLSILCEYCLPFLKIGGVFIAQKGSSTTQDEIADAEHALATLGGKIEHVHEITILGLEPRTVIIIKKTNSTPEDYPRKPGTPSKNPL